MEVGGQHHAPAALPPGKTRYPLYRRLGRPQGQSGWVQKISPPTGIRSLDRPACSKSLYQLSYPGPICCTQFFQIYLALYFYFSCTDGTKVAFPCYLTSWRHLLVTDVLLPCVHVLLCASLQSDSANLNVHSTWSSMTFKFPQKWFCS